MNDVVTLNAAEELLDEVDRCHRLLRPYPRYEPTNIPWFNQLPVGWKLKRAKWLVTGCQNGTWGSEPDGDNNIACVRVADFDRATLRVNLESPTYRAVTSSERRGRQLEFNDLLLEKSGGGELQPVGAVMLYDHELDAVCSNFIARMPVAHGNDPRFLAYLHAHLYSRRVNTRSIKQTTGIQNLDSRQYLDELVAQPPQDQQRAIAAFLDRETEKIDSLVVKKRRLIELLGEKRTALISRAVTKGLDPDAPTKPSGIDWLGDVPAHWDVVRLKFHVTLLPGYAFASEGFTKRDDDVRLLRGANIAPGRIIWDDEVRWDASDISNYRRFELREGDIVFGMDRPWISTGVRVAAISAVDLPCLLLQRVARIRSRTSVRQQYVIAVIESKSFKDYFAPIFTGVSVPHVSPEQILNYAFALPSDEEQVRMLRHIESESKKMESLAHQIDNAISRLNEYRSSLISAAVTGQIDVRGEVAR